MRFVVPSIRSFVTQVCFDPTFLLLRCNYQLGNSRKTLVTHVLRCQIGCRLYRFVIVGLRCIFAHPVIEAGKNIG